MDNAATPLFSRVDTVLLNVRDLDASRRWYEETLNLPVRFATPYIVVFEMGGPTSLTICCDPNEPLTENSPRNYPVMYAPDIEATHRYLSERGINPQPIQGEGDSFKYFSFEDPDRNKIDVCWFPEG